MSNDTDAPAPLRKFSWPFAKRDTPARHKNTSSEVTDPRDYYDALALAEDGFYPIGANGQWHGGIHFGRQTGTMLDQDNGIRCIADGEVIAWKIDDAYPTVEYDSCGSARYSTGFVLVRHRLALPPAPSARQVEGGSTNDDPTLLFYSLYVHLRDWQSYRLAPDDPRPFFWGEGTYVVGDGASDADRSRNPHIPEGGVGLNLRNAANAVVGFAPRGTRLRLGERRGTSGYYAVTEVISGSVVPPGLIDAYAFRDEMTEIPAEPATKGSIVIPESPFRIAAGNLVGHLGEYMRYIDAGAMCSDDPRPLVQIDVFTTEDIEAFIEASRVRAAQLQDSSKTLLVIESGAQLAVPAGGGGPPSAEQLIAASQAGGGPIAGHTRVIPIKALDAVAEEDGTRWWLVDVGTRAGETAIGWVRERDHANVRLASPWEWPGFEFVRIDNTRPDQFYAHRVAQDGQATPEEHDELEQRGGPADAGSIFCTLYDTIDHGGDKKITADEIRGALRKTWLAQALSHLIVEHESEWSGPMAKWDAIDELIPENRKKDWVKEKERIESLLWWGELGGRHGLPSEESLIAYNLHPIGFIGVFKTRATASITVEMLQQIFTNAPADRLHSIAEEVNNNIEAYKLDSPLRLAHFFAQVREEVGASASFSESLNYSPNGLIATFSYFARSPQDAQTYGRVAGRPANQEAIASRAYASRNGNGNIASGDGWLYKGRGLKMTTGRANYRDLQDNYHLVWPGTAPDFVGNPDLLSTAQYAVQSAVFFWIRHGLYRIADGGSMEANVDSITSIINRHTDSYAARRSHFTSIWNANVFDSIDE
ncbi:hypothetical protein E4582_05155 [Luteimonas yindakuii]|uniref:Chitinase n=1 Tax=Luteimonas yindakuii TaxID=2565782 RepID=A0A4Z1R3I3_9GAMM|nr:hypothetical protein [Luteimonas yindakuii]TKS54214.1 hypothetical protein E4582_05155 [Luteimonas yindakuii]